MHHAETAARPSDQAAPPRARGLRWRGVLLRGVALRDVVQLGVVQLGVVQLGVALLCATLLYATLLGGCAAVKAGARHTDRGDTAPPPPIHEVSLHLGRADGAPDAVAMPYYCADGSCWVGRDAVLREEHIGNVTVQQGESQAFLTLSFNEKGKAALRLLARGGSETGPLVLDVDGRVLTASPLDDALRTGTVQVSGPTKDIFDLFDQLRGHTHPDELGPASGPADAEDAEDKKADEDAKDAADEKADTDAKDPADKKADKDAKDDKASR
jgi:hypothetical protein